MFGDDKAVHLQVVCMAESYYVWAGDSGGRMDNLAAAIQTRFDTMPASRELIDGGGDTSGVGKRMSTRLSKRLKAPVFLSVNFEQLDDELALFVELQLVGLLTEQPSQPTEPTV